MEEGRAKISDKEEYPPPEEIAVRQRVQLPEKVMLFKRNYKLLTLHQQGHLGLTGLPQPQNGWMFLLPSFRVL